MEFPAGSLRCDEDMGEKLQSAAAGELLSSMKGRTISAVNSVFCPEKKPTVQS